jgi:hypothetical protein
MRDGTPTYLNVVVPGINDELIAAIEERADGGRLVVYSGVRTVGGQDVVEPLLDTELESFRYDKGGRSGSATLVGYITTTTEVSKVVNVNGISNISRQSDGKRQIRCEPSFFLQPGDVAVYGTEPSEKLIVGMIALTVNPTTMQMDVSER